MKNSKKNSQKTMAKSSIKITKPALKVRSTKPVKKGVTKPMAKKVAVKSKVTPAAKPGAVKSSATKNKLRAQNLRWQYCLLNKWRKLK